MQKPLQTISPTLGLYIHIPFCKTICVYCNFLTFANKTRWIPEYIEALKMEIREKSTKFQNYQVETIYFGGGTPSLIEAELIVEIIKSIKINFTLSPNIEISLEANPESLTAEKLHIYSTSGIKRISLGVQSLNPKTLWKVARPHDEKATLKALELLKNSQWKNFGCDLIMGLPYQTLAEFKKHLKIILAYQPAHLSSYFLSYDTKRIDTFIADSPGEEEQIKMYQYLVKKLRKEGFDHYEVSNYARPGFQCQHNLRYWNQEEYLGLGLGAHSYINKTVSENSRNFEAYLKNPLLLEDSYPLDPDTERMDFIMLNLRKAEGLDLKKYSDKYGETATQEIIKKAQPYSESKHLHLTTKNIQPTNKGFLVLDKITRDLL
jgi:oxygen-independent coproporphyrinogen-3 oxidase